jgi:hypothetical protein
MAQIKIKAQIVSVSTRGLNVVLQGEVAGRLTASSNILRAKFNCFS